MCTWGRVSRRAPLAPTAYLLPLLLLLLQASRMSRREAQEWKVAAGLHQRSAYPLYTMFRLGLPPCDGGGEQARGWPATGHRCGALKEPQARIRLPAFNVGYSVVCGRLVGQRVPRASADLRLMLGDVA